MIETISQLKEKLKIGPKILSHLSRLKIKTTFDLLFHFPIRYENRTKTTPISQAERGIPQLFSGQITNSIIKRRGKNQQAVLTLEDTSGYLDIRFYHCSQSYLDAMINAEWIHMWGEPRFLSNGIELIHPEIQLFNEKEQSPNTFLTAIYPSTEGLSQFQIRQLIAKALKKGAIECGFENLLPEAGHSSIWESITRIHCPSPDTEIESNRIRLALEELVAHRLNLINRRKNTRKLVAPNFDVHQQSLAKKFTKSLPFKLTNSQKKVIKEINLDLAKNFAMLRLLQGDVGSGKTIVAAISALNPIGNRFQVALMSPTEVLAEQHFSVFDNWFSPMGIKTVSLKGSLSTKQRNKTLKEISTGDANLIIGTHALFQKDVIYKNLGLIIIDEQHRFGVAQRLALREKGKYLTPHQLIMTATPIPRTLAMTRFADLDVSTITELPSGRSPINTIILNQDRDSELMNRLDNIFSEGGQVYWVCPLIEQSTELSYQAANTRLKIIENSLPHRRSALIHGKMDSLTKKNTMKAFTDGRFDILVATTVIEVGVNIVNANVIIIENPEKLGLAQLHQLRGRVGRGSKKSFCILLYGNEISSAGLERLKTLKHTLDGFKIAEADLSKRGPGEVLTGTRQAGIPDFRVVDLSKDYKLIDSSKAITEQLVSRTDSRIQKIIDRWIANPDKFLHV